MSDVEYVTGLPSGLQVIKNAPQPERPDLPVLVVAGTYRAAKAWAVRAGLRSHEYRWMSDSTATRGLQHGDRWFVDLGIEDAPSREAIMRCRAAQVELDVAIRRGWLTLKWWKLTKKEDA